MTKRPAKQRTSIKIQFVTEDKIGKLKKISEILSAMGLNVKKTTARISFWNKKKFIGKIVLETDHFDQLLKLVNHLEEIEKESKWIRKTSNRS